MWFSKSADVHVVDTVGMVWPSKTSILLKIYGRKCLTEQQSWSLNYDMLAIIVDSTDYAA